MSEVSRDLADACRECWGQGGRNVRGGPGACERCGRLGPGTPRGFRWLAVQSVPPVTFAHVADAMAAAAFASDPPAGLDTLHLVSLPGGQVEAVAVGETGPHWLIRR